MTVMLSSAAAITLYLAITGIQWREIALKRNRLLPSSLVAVIIALLFHAASIAETVFLEDGYNLGFFQVSSLIFVFIVLSTLLSMLRRPMQNLLVVLLPLAALSVAVGAFGPATRAPASDPEAGLLIHIALSVVAYAVLTIATLQALALALLDLSLKQHRTTGLVRLLPPLQLMETMLFELIWLGVSLLTLSIISGFLFLEDLFAQHLVHKTILTIAAWVTFSTLLWGRWFKGWRSRTAVKWTLGGFTVLMLAFFGSKFVLELLLGRV